MRAAVLREPGARFEITDLTLRALGTHDVHVQIAASGVCRSDEACRDDLERQ
jgi:S-(hydroxymethyl)glutathione dehydrogenase/alcohol dehydrogenase